jgi:hypothetical protein
MLICPPTPQIADSSPHTHDPLPDHLADLDENDSHAPGRIPVESHAYMDPPMQEDNVQDHKGPAPDPILVDDSPSAAPSTAAPCIPKSPVDHPEQQYSASQTDPSSSSPQNATAATRLLEFSIVVHPLHLSICLDCRAIVPWEQMYGHVKKNHHSRHSIPLPPEEVFNSLLRVEGAHLAFIRPVNAIPPISGLLVREGFACTATHPHPMIFASKRMLQKHFTEHHHEDGLQAATHSRSTLVQALGQLRGHLGQFGAHQTVIEVTSTPEPSPAGKRFSLFIEEYTNRPRPQATIYKALPNTRARSSFTERTSWDRPLEGLELGPILHAARTPYQNQEPLLFRLQGLVQRYMSDIAGRLNELSTLVLRHIHSENPQ